MSGRRQRLQAVVQNTGAHIEHLFKWLTVLQYAHTWSAVTALHRRNFWKLLFCNLQGSVAPHF